METDEPHGSYRSDGPGFVRHYSQFGLESVIQSAQTELDGVTLATLCYRSKEASGTTPDAWTIALGTKPHETEAVYGDQKIAKSLMPTNTICVYTPNTDWSVRFNFSGILPIRLITISKSKIASLLPEEFRGIFEIESISNRPFRSYNISSMYNSIYDDANHDYRMGPIYTETMLRAIALDLLRMAGTTKGNARASRKGDLSDKCLKKIDDFIASNAHQAITTQMLADLLNIPNSTFSDAIKTATGMTPYQLVISKRIERARQLIGTTKMPLSHIAHECGFSSQSHMNDVFRAKVGATPNSFR